jgi:hypothetical protein
VQRCSPSHLVVLRVSSRDCRTMVSVKHENSDHIDCHFSTDQDIPWFQPFGILSFTMLTSCRAASQYLCEPSKAFEELCSQSMDFAPNSRTSLLASDRYHFLKCGRARPLRKPLTAPARTRLNFVSLSSCLIHISVPSQGRASRRLLSNFI